MNRKYNNSRISLVVLGLIFSITLGSCVKNKEEETNNFDRQSLLSHYAANIIRPSYKDLQTSTDELKSAVDALVGDVSEGNLDLAQAAWIKAYSDLQDVNCFDFGPAGEEGAKKGFTIEVATFPASKTKIENYISNNDMTLNNFDRDSRGFLAVEYLLFDLDGDDSKIITALAEQKRKDYLATVAANIKSRTDAVVSGWQNYEAAFVSNNGNDAGSSITLLYNAFLVGYEHLKNYKVGLPAGLRVGQTSTEKDKVEAYYSGKSLDFAKLHYQAVMRTWEGKNKAGQDGTGFEEYVLSAPGGQALVDQTRSQMTDVVTALDNIPTNVPLSTTIDNNVTLLSDLYNELSAFTRYVKSDLSSLLGLYISYSSGDGD